MSFYSNKVHSHGNVPFSWEKKPGVSKETTQILATTKLLDHMKDNINHDDIYDHRAFVLKLPPPPPSPRHTVPPPPGGSGGGALDQQPLLMRSSSMRLRGLRKQFGDQRHDFEDPFLAALKLCTKSSVKRSSGESTHGDDRHGDKLTVSGLRSLFGLASCKRPERCAVREGSLVRVSRRLHYNQAKQGSI